MGKPSPEELQTALSAAALMREQGNDEHHIAKSLLNLHYRIGYLEKVLQSADRFLYSGQAVKEHQDLVRAIRKAKDIDALTRGEDSETYGLS